MDVDALLEPRSADKPSGENLEYDEVFINMELASQPTEESLQSGTPEPDYAALSKAALTVLEKSHDIRAAVFLAQAALRREGIEGIAGPLKYVRGCIERHWDTCHPEVEDDGEDPTMRSNAVLALSDPEGILSGLRRAPFTDSPSFGKFSLRDVLIASGEIEASPDAETIPEAATIEAAIKDTDEARLSALAASLQGMVADVEAIEAAFGAKCPGQGPDLEPLKKLLNRIRNRIPAEGSDQDDDDIGGGAESEDMQEPTDETTQPAARQASGVAPGAISGSEDVKKALDQIIAYYARREPSSPVPVLLNRAKRLVNADFLTIVRDMAPSGMDNVNTVGGLKDDDD
jgi:type VI secretion system protein ImpA